MAADVVSHHPLHELERRLERGDFGGWAVDGHHVEMHGRRYGQRDDAARPFFLFGSAYGVMRLGVVLRMMMDRRTMSVSVVGVVVGTAMDVKRQCLRLQRAHRQRDQRGQKLTHGPSLWDAARSVNLPRLFTLRHRTTSGRRMPRHSIAP